MKGKWFVSFVLMLALVCCPLYAKAGTAQDVGKVGLATAGWFFAGAVVLAPHILCASLIKTTVHPTVSVGPTVSLNSDMEYAVGMRGTGLVRRRGDLSLGCSGKIAFNLWDPDGSIFLDESAINVGTQWKNVIGRRYLFLSGYIGLGVMGLAPSGFPTDTFYLTLPVGINVGLNPGIDLDIGTRIYTGLLRGEPIYLDFSIGWIF